MLIEHWEADMKEQGYGILLTSTRADELSQHFYRSLVDGQKQRRGLGRMLIEHWEADMKEQGYGILLTSTRADELSQHFYRSLGYKDCGCLLIDSGQYAQPAELFLVKEIRV